jgi:hypothetical protein
MTSSFELSDAEVGIWPATTHQMVRTPQPIKTKETGKELAVTRSPDLPNWREIGPNSPLDTSRLQRTSK